MPTRKAEAEWRGNLAEGSGRLELGSGAFGLARSHIAPGVIADATTGLGQCPGLEFQPTVAQWPHRHRGHTL